MLSVVIVLKGLVEFAAMLLLGQGLVFMLSFGKHERNPVYQLMRLLTSPVTAIVRRITPSAIVDRHVPAVALFLLFWVWIALIVMKARLMSVPA